MLPYGSICLISFDIITGGIVVVACFDRFILSPESVISSMLILGVFGGFKYNLLN